MRKVIFLIGLQFSNDSIIAIGLSEFLIYLHFHLRFSGHPGFQEFPKVHSLLFYFLVTYVTDECAFGTFGEPY